MGILDGCLGGYTPICEDCGITLCSEIDPYEYQENQEYWDNWRCEICSKYTRKEYMENKGKTWYPAFKKNK